LPRLGPEGAERTELKPSLRETRVKCYERVLRKASHVEPLVRGKRVRAREGQEAVVHSHDAARNAWRRLGLVLDDEVDVVLKQAHGIGLADLAQLHLDFRVTGANAANPRGEKFLNLERAGLDSQAAASAAPSDGVDDARQSLKEGRAKFEQGSPRARRRHAIFRDPLEQADLELLLELANLGMNAWLRDGVREFARRARVVSGRRDSVETLELVELNHSP
jgi:hypothetical protein